MERTGPASQPQRLSSSSSNALPILKEKSANMDKYRGSTLSQQLETGQRESTSVEKEMERRVDRYASGRDTYARDTPHDGKESSSSFDWKRRERSSATQWSPPFTASSSSVQDGGGRFHSGFDLPTSANSPQPSSFSGNSCLLGTEIVHDETSHMSPPKRPRPGWGEAVESGQDDASHSTQPKRPRLGWGQGLAKYERKKGADGEDCSKSTGSAKEENLKKTNSQPEEEMLVERISKPGSHVSPGSTSRSVLSEIGNDKPVSPVEGDVHKPDASRIVDLSSDTRPCSAVHGANTSAPEAVAVPPEALGLPGDSLTSQTSDIDSKISQCRVPVHPNEPVGISGAQKKDPSPEHGLTESSGARLVPGFVGIPRDLSGWSKEAITQQLMMVEAEVEVVEKELAKLAREDDGDFVDDATTERPIKTVAEHVDEHNVEQGGSPKESVTPDTKALDLEEVEVTPVVSSEEGPSSPVAEVAFPHVADQAPDPQRIPSSVEESSLSPTLQEAQTEASDPSKTNSDCQNLQDSVEEMPLAVNSERCKSFICGCHGPDCELCDRSDEEDELPGTNLGIFGLSDLMFYRYVLSVWSLIMENRRLARKANVPLQHLLSKDDNNLDFKVNGSIEDTPVWIENEESHSKIREKMQEKLSERKKLLKFKERVLALRYRALREEQYHNYQLQPPGMFQRRDRVKPVRRWEVERRNAAAFALTSQRSTLRLRPVISGPTRLCTGSEDGQLRRKSLAITPVNQLRQDLKMPAMILDEKERCSRRFVTTNGLIEDPVAFEQERKSINPWTEEEKLLFMEKFPLFNKNFSKIASYFQHKTTADCVEFYYQNQKSEEFEKIKRRRQQLKKRRDYSLSGSFLATLPPSNSFGRCKDVNSSRVEALTSAAYAASRDCVKAPRGSSHKVVEKARPVITYDHGNLDQLVGKSVCVKEIKPVTAEAKEIKVVSASDAVTSGISPYSPNIGTPSTSKNCREKLSVKCGSAFIPPFSRVVTAEEHGDRKGVRTSPGVRDIIVENEDTESQWTDCERELFVQAVSSYGKDFKSISDQVVSKTPAQCRTFFSKIRKRFRLDELAEQVSESGPLTVNLDVGGFHTKSTAYSADVKMDEVGDSAGQNSKSAELAPVAIQQDRNAVEGTCKVEVVEGNELESGLSLLGKAVEDQQLIDLPLGKDGDTEVTEACEESPGKSEDAIEGATVVPTADGQKQPEQIVKVEPFQFSTTEAPVVENWIRVQKDVVEVCTVKNEGERAESGVEYGEPTWKEEKFSASSTSVVDPCCTLKAHEEDLGHGKAVKAEPFVSLDSVGPRAAEVPVVTIQQTAPISLTSQPVTQGGPVRERGTRLNAAGEFKPRREPTSWTQEEKEKFAEIIRRHGKDWTLLDESLPGKSMTQIKTYFQNSKAKLGFLSDTLANPGTRGGCNRKRKPEESDTSSNAGSAGQICPPKVSIQSEDVLQKVVSSSMMTISTNMGTSGVGVEGMGFSHFNPGSNQSGEDSAAIDLQKMIRRICSVSDYGGQPNLVSGLVPLFQPGVTSSYPGPSPQQSLLLAAQKQQLMAAHPPAQQPLSQPVGLQQQQQTALTNHKQQQLITHVVQHLQQQAAAVQQLQQQQQHQTSQLAVHQPQQMVQQLQQLVQLQQQQQQHLAQVAKHISPQLLHQQSHQHIPLGPNVHSQQLVSRAKLATAGVQQQVSHVTRLHPSHSQQQLFQQQKQILQQQKQQQLLLQQIQVTQLQHDLQLHQQMQVQKQQQVPQHHLQQQQVQHGQPLSIFRGQYQKALAEAELLRHSEVADQRSTPSNLGLLPREDLQVQSQRSQQLLAQQQQVRATTSSDSQRLRMGDVKLFGQSLLSQPQPSPGTPSISSSHKTGSHSWQPASPGSTVPLAMSTNSVSKTFATEPSLLPSPAFVQPGGTAHVGEGSQSWPVASAGNLELWSSMMGGLQGGVAFYKNEDPPKSEVSSVHEAVTKMAARLTREGHELDGEDLHTTPIGVISSDLQRSADFSTEGQQHRAGM